VLFFFTRTIIQKDLGVMFTMMTKHNWYFVNDDEERKGGQGVLTDVREQ